MWPSVWANWSWLPTAHIQLTGRTEGGGGEGKSE